MGGGYSLHFDILNSNKIGKQWCGFRVGSRFTPIALIVTGYITLIYFRLKDMGSMVGTGWGLCTPSRCKCSECQSEEVRPSAGKRRE